MINPNKPIYSVFLIKVEPKNPNHKQTKREQIETAILKKETSIAHRILVQETSNEEEFQEIITQEKFPSTIIYLRREDIFKEKIVTSNDKLNTPLLIKPIICNKLEIGFSPIRKTYRKHLIKATTKQLEEYLINNTEEKLKKEFNELKEKSITDFNYLTYDKAKDETKKLKRIIKEYNEKTLRRNYGKNIK